MDKVLQDKAIRIRNDYWAGNPYIPSWVDTNKVELDQFFTRPEIAENCYSKLISHLLSKGVNIDDCVFIEPSAGSCSFYKLLPKKRSIGLDILPLSRNIIEQDFLSWQIPIKYKNKIKVFVGNPPFGYRGWLALSFMNHTAKFADFIGYILPMSFQSEGKGSPKNRVVGAHLVEQEIIPANSFVSPSGKIEKVNALWQIWEKGEKKKDVKPTCREWIDIFTVDMRKERLCGMGKMDDADYFLQRTFFNTPPKLVRSFSDVRYVCGYGLIFKKNKSDIKAILNKVNWVDYSNLAAHNCRHISMYHIEKVLTDNLFTDARF